MLKTTEKLILDELKKQQKTIHWLSKEVNATNRHLYYIFNEKSNQKRPLPQPLLDRINNALGTDFKLNQNG